MTTTDHQPLTAEQLAEIENRANAATPGPWGLGADDSIGLGIENDGFGGFAFDVILAEATPQGDRNHDMECTPNRDNITLSPVRADAEFIAHAREDVPALLAEVKRLRADRDRAREIAVALEQENARLQAGITDAINDLQTGSPVEAEATLTRLIDGEEAAR